MKMTTAKGQLSDGAQWLHDQACGAYSLQKTSHQESVAYEQGVIDTIKLLQIFQILPEDKLLELKAWGNSLPESRSVLKK
jgi:hypothetical protein